MPKMCLLRTITYGESSEFVREKQTYNVLHNLKLKIMSTNQNMFLLIASIQHTHTTVCKKEACFVHDTPRTYPGSFFKCGAVCGGGV